MIPEVIYILCGVTSSICAWLLWKGFRATKTNLLFWSGFCFFGFALNNVLLYVDLAILPTTLDLSLLRSVIALASVMVLLFGLVWESR